MMIGDMLQWKAWDFSAVIKDSDGWRLTNGSKTLAIFKEDGLILLATLIFQSSRGRGRVLSMSIDNESQVEFFLQKLKDMKHEGVLFWEVLC